MTSWVELMSKSRVKRIAAQSKAQGKLQAERMLLEPWGPNDLMATAAVRYCLGRRTYIVNVCADWVVRNWENFQSQTKTAIRADVEELLAGNRAGDDCDRADWERVRKLWANK